MVGDAKWWVLLASQLENESRGSGEKMLHAEIDDRPQLSRCTGNDRPESPS